MSEHESDRRYDVFRENKPWGFFEQYVANTECTVKLLVLGKGQRISLQTHEHRDELWIAYRGQGNVTVGNQYIPMFSPQYERMVWIPRGTEHRAMASPSLDTPFWILEISFGHFDESDIVRIEDDYDRVV